MTSQAAAEFSLPSSFVWTTWLIAVGLSLIGFWTINAFYWASPEFFGLGIPSVLLFGSGIFLVIVLPTVSLAFLAVKVLTRFLRIRARKRRLLLLGVAISSPLVVLRLGSRPITPYNRFESRVCSPIPTSVSEIDAHGFTAFLANRWLVSFHIAPEDVPFIVAMRSLKLVAPISLRAMLARDIFFEKRTILLSTLPTEAGIKCYKGKVIEGEQSVSGSWLMYDESNSNAWFFSYYQN